MCVLIRKESGGRRFKRGTGDGRGQKKRSKSGERCQCQVIAYCESGMNSRRHVAQFKLRSGKPSAHRKKGSFHSGLIYIEINDLETTGRLTIAKSDGDIGSRAVRSNVLARKVTVFIWISVALRARFHVEASIRTSTTVCVTTTTSRTICDSLTSIEAATVWRSTSSSDRGRYRASGLNVAAVDMRRVSVRDGNRKSLCRRTCNAGIQNR
jgi:hypothetical protein